MAWEGKSVGDICRQLKDPTRNGGRSLVLLRDHIAKDDLVAPGTQEQFGMLVQAWIDSGAGAQLFVPTRACFADPVS
jgi:hypothetical protein